MGELTTTQLTHETLLIRRMSLKDLEAVVAIESVSFGRHHWNKEAFSSEIKNSMGRYYSLLALPEERLIGYCGYWIILDEAHITTIAIHPEYRGQNLGELLLYKILDKMSSQSVKWATLEVRASNISAQQLYYKYTFNTAGIRPKYYQDTFEDALIMTTPNINDEAFRRTTRQHRERLALQLGGQLPLGDD
jgi:[ribosomal protein S18]-alanine N-acetyltransferase